MRLSDFNQKILSCKELLLTFALFFLPGIIAPPEVFGTEFNHPNFLALIIVTGLAETGMILYLVTHIGGRRLADYNIRPMRPRGLLYGFLACLLIFPLLLLTGLLLTLSAESVPGEWAMPGFRWYYTNYSLLPITLCACLATGYMEELYYRSYLPTEFFRHGMPAAPAMIIPVLLFGAGHFYQGVIGFAVACLLGLYFTGVLRLTKNLHVPAVAHGLYNFCALMLSGMDFFCYDELLSTLQTILRRALVL